MKIKFINEFAQRELEKNTLNNLQIGNCNFLNKPVLQDIGTGMCLHNEKIEDDVKDIETYKKLTNDKNN